MTSSPAILNELAAQAEFLAFDLPEAADCRAELLTLRVDSMTVRFKPTKPAALALGAKLRAGAKRKKPFPASRRAGTVAEYLCLGGPYAGQTIVLSADRGDSGTYPFSVDDWSGRYRKGNGSHAHWVAS